VTEATHWEIEALKMTRIAETQAILCSHFHS
jgi:hypothetical protein